MSIPKPGSLIFLQDYQTTQQNGSTNYCPGTGSCNTSPKQRQHNAPSEKVEPFTWGAKRMDTVLSAYILTNRNKFTNSRTGKVAARKLYERTRFSKRFQYSLRLRRRLAPQKVTKTRINCHLTRRVRNDFERPKWVAFCLSACEPRCAEQDIPSLEVTHARGSNVELMSP